MKTVKPAHTIDIVFSLALLGAFSACVLLVLMTGAGVYRESVSEAEEMFSKRTCIAYITEKIRHFNSVGAVGIKSFGDGDALVLTGRVDDTCYETLIYTYNGELMELYSERGLSLLPRDGTVIIPTGEISFMWMSKNLLCVGVGGVETYIGVLGGEQEVGR